MILYNITINIDNNIHDQWLKWMQEKHIPDVIATGKFSSARLVKVLTKEETEGTTTYSVQFLTPNKETLEKYYIENAPTLRQEGISLFGDKMLTFRTELEIISDY